MGKSVSWSFRLLAEISFCAFRTKVSIFLLVVLWTEGHSWFPETTAFLSALGPLVPSLKAAALGWMPCHLSLIFLLWHLSLTQPENGLLKKWNLFTLCPVWTFQDNPPHFKVHECKHIYKDPTPHIVILCVCALMCVCVCWGCLRSTLLATCKSTLSYY